MIFNDILQATLKVTVTEAMLVEQISRSMIDQEFRNILEELEQFCNQ